MSEQAAAPRWRDFFLIWTGQLISALGSGLTNFGVGVWVYQQTGSTTQFALIYVCGTIPALLAMPIAGSYIDRVNRRRMMLVSDVATALVTVLMLTLVMGGKLTIPLVYLTVALGTAFISLQQPTFAAIVPLLIPKQQLGRVAGLMQFAPAVARILAPILAGLLLPILGLPGLITFDLVTFLVAIALTLLARVPDLPGKPPARRSILADARLGWSYIADRPGLLSLLGFSALLNLIFGFGQVLLAPLVLSFATAPQLSYVLATAATGALCGALLMSIWGGPAKRSMGVLGAAPLLGIGMLLMGPRAWVPSIAAGAFLVFLSVPLINASAQALWQLKVVPELQGRVFAMRMLLGQFTAPLAFLLAGPTADRLFEPMLLPGGALAGSVGAWIGVGPGRGIALLFMILGVLMIAAAVAGLAYPRLRAIDSEVPDALPEIAR